MVKIFDFYVDEPACLGVPPYLSPYCRYTAGVLVNKGIPPEKISYQTVDQWRENNKELTEDPELIVLIGGFTVPGKYLGGKIGTLAEIIEFLDYRNKYQPNSITLLGGPIQYAPSYILDQIKSKNGIVAFGDVEAVIEKSVSYSGGQLRFVDSFQTKQNRLSDLNLTRTCQQVDDWAVRGAFITTLHPCFPYLINELETYRGCTRQTFCSFCTEMFYGKPEFRSQQGIVNEVKELYQLGNRYFRLGRQADIITYGADLGCYSNGFPKPQPDQLEKLYIGIRQVAPELKVLHLDNMNPGAVASFEKEAVQIIDIITRYNTQGDTAAMGLESIDPIVVDMNRLKCNQSEALRAIEIVNEYGARRKNGIPTLLPGLNFIHGLPGESDRTFQMNFEFLLELLEKNLLLRRINIRQVFVHSGTRLEGLKKSGNLSQKTGLALKRTKPALLDKKFIYYRDKIRQEVDRPMLEKIFPLGTILKEVILEAKNPGYVLGRQLGSYPVTVKISLYDQKIETHYKNRQPIDIIVTGYKERSILGLTHPIRINQLGLPALAQIPGIGKKRASNLLLARPIKHMDDLIRVVEGSSFGTPNDYIFDAS